MTIMLIALGAAIAIVAVQFPWLADARPFLTIPLVLLWPGLALVMGIPELGGLGLTTLALGVGLSLAISAICGLCLNFSHGLNASGWSWSLGGFTLLACAFAIFRPARSLASSPRPRLRRLMLPACLFAISSAVSAFAIVAAANGARAHQEYAFTEFWMAPRLPAEQNIVTIGISNEEKRDLDYQVVMVADGAMVDRWPSIRLPAGQTWTIDVSLTERLRRAQRVEAWLYRSGAPDEVYRKVWLARTSG